MKEATRDLDVLLSNARRLVSEKDYAAALIWANQLNAVCDDESSEFKQGLEELLVSVISGTSSNVIFSALTSTNRGQWQKPVLESLHTAAETLVTLDPKNAGKRVILAQAKSLLNLLARDPSQKVNASAEELDEYLKMLWDIAARANRLNQAEGSEIIAPGKRVELSAVVLGNARAMLPRFLSAFSDGHKAKVLCLEVKARLLPGLEIHHVKSATESIDTAIGALDSGDYGLAHKSIAAAEKTMSNYTWKH